jgi:diaminohydroxyphosphoribosylaminopyrimidine deaminase/5-amino-6-(5-phosphoribosylamino)uracil reductase
MESEVQRDDRFMAQALRLAGAMAGRTTPNPAVGCVIVRQGRIVGRGATADGGRPHAETIALGRAGDRARGATAYVTLEPCAHYGKTPPCAGALVAAGIARVVIATRDPYPKVRGRGITILRRAGIEVIVGCREDEARAQNRGFFTRIARGRPLSRLKLAMSLDGRIAASSGDSRWISSVESRATVHRWRAQADAVIVGVGTVLADNPQLNCRIAGGRDPVRVVVDTRLRTPVDARMLRLRSAAGAIVVTSKANLKRAARRYRAPNVEVVGVGVRDGSVDLVDMMREFGRRGWCNVLFEGGSHLAGAALRAGIIDEVAIFIAPKILGGGIPAIDGIDAESVRRAIALDSISARQSGLDLLVEGSVTRRRSLVGSPRR